MSVPKIHGDTVPGREEILRALALSWHRTSLSSGLAWSCPAPATIEPEAYMVLGLNTVCDVYFAGSIDVLCDAWSLTPDVAGVP